MSIALGCIIAFVMLLLGVFGALWVVGLGTRSASGGHDE